jgi:hypothetical protein
MERMKSKSRIPINTLDRALKLAQVISRDLAADEGKAQRSLQVFSALTDSDVEAWAAFVIWKARGETIKELLKK